MADKRLCACGKSVTVKNDGTPRQHVCNAPGGPTWKDELVTEQSVVPADVDKTEFSGPIPEPHVCTYTPGGRNTVNRCACGQEVPDGPAEVPPPGKVTDDQWRMPWTRDAGFRFKVNKGASFRADCGHMVQTHAPYRERPEGGFECRGEWALAADAPVPSCMIGRPDTLDRVPAGTGTYGPTDVERTHVHSFQWADDGRGHSGTFCVCGEEEPEEMDSPTEEMDSPTEELLRVIDDPADLAANRECTKGPLVPAHHSGYLDCGHDVLAGDLIRADGEGGWECEECADNDEPENWNGTGRPRPSASNVKLPEPVTEQPRLLDTIAHGAGTVLDAMTPEQRSAALGAQQMADAFSMPTPQGSGPVRGTATALLADQDARDAAGLAGTPDPFSAPTAAAPVLGSATDQPQTWRNNYGQYVIKDPRTGDYKRNRGGKPQGFTRATTFAKTLIDQFGIHQWEMRTLLAGLALRPDLVSKAKGLDVAADKDALQDIIAAAKDAAGGNDAATDGTDFHTVTEWIDAGRMKPEEAPEKFRPEALAYSSEMGKAGLQTKPEWIERVLFTDRVGEDVAGTADRILLERDGTHVIGDVKSGKGVDLGQREIAMQLKHYAMAVNQFGLYKKTSPPPRQRTDDPAQTGYWEPWTGPPVSEEYGIVMHVPLVRPAGTPAYCDIYRIDLRGVVPYAVDRAHHGAAWVRGWRKEKGFLSPYSPPAAAPRRTWAEAFASVTTPDEANRLWQAAVDAGMDLDTLDTHVQNARAALAKLRYQ